MPELNDEMKAIADYAIKTAREKYKVELDYSIQSISSLENILEKIYWGFYSRTDDKSDRGIVYNTAIIWGSYLGEFMRLKWGGRWAIKETKQIISIRDMDFSPISFVYQKIIGKVKTSVGDYIFETNGTISRANSVAQREAFAPAAYIKPASIEKPVMIAKPAIVEKPPIAEQVLRPVEKVPNKGILSKQPRKVNRDLLLAIGGIAGVIIIFIIFIVGFIKIRDGSLAAVGLFPTATSTNTEIQNGIAFIPTAAPQISSQTPTITLLPTYTPKPTNTPRPTRTPKPTDTATPTSTFTYTPTSTETEIPWRSPTPTRTPTQTEPPPPPTATQAPPPTATLPPPPTIESCEVSPSSISAGVPTDLTFIAHFSAPGYSFTAEVQGGYPGASGCSATDDNNDGTAECGGSSGMVPSSTRVDVLFTSPVGNCSASLSTP